MGPRAPRLSRHYVLLAASSRLTPFQTHRPVPRATASDSAVTPVSGGRFALLRRVRPFWWAVAVPALVAASALVSTSPIRDAATLAPVPEATLRLPVGYIVLAPVSALLDTLTLLSLRQHVALLVTLLVVFAGWWWWRGRVVAPTVLASRRWVRRASRVALALVGVVSVYTAALLMPRPMAALEVAPDIVVIDFHAHTKYSHDGRWNWTPDDVRRWHRDAGYAVAYVTDHRTFEGARDAWANNPRLAGEGVSLLPGIEVVWKGEHVNVLDADRVYNGILTPTLRDIDPDALRLASLIPGREPVLIETLPGHLAGMVSASGPGTPGIRAVELIDGSPKGLGQTRRERARIVHVADSLHLALVSGSDSHGWGFAAQGWTLLVVPGWRAATPEQLSTALSATLRTGGSKSTRVVERRVADTDAALALPFTVPLVLWEMLRTLSPDERVMWIVWTVLVAGLLALSRRRQAVG